MGPGDFLHKQAQTPLVEHFLMTGVRGSIATNSRSILEAARACFIPSGAAAGEPKLRLRFWVDPRGESQPPWPKPYFRGLGHLVFAGFDRQSSMLMDLRTNRAIGRFSPAMSEHQPLWTTVIFPVLMSIMGATVGVTELHSACVARHDSGLLLVGGSGSGKSTLSLALAEAGFSFLADDRTYLTRAEGRITAWGLPTQLKLRADAVAWFPELDKVRQTSASDSERDLWIDPASALGIMRARRCEPMELIFLERRETPTCELSALDSDHAARQLEADLLVEDPDASERQRDLIANLVKLPCWHLAYGGSPQDVAQFLQARFSL